MRKMIINRVGPVKQNIQSRTYNKTVCMTAGTIKENGTDGTCTVTLVNGFDAEHIRIPSTTAPTVETVTGGIEYPPIGAEVIILHPEGDIGSGFILNSPLDVRNSDVETELFNQGDIEIKQGGWKKTYDIETGDTVYENESFIVTIEPSTKLNIAAPVIELNGNSKTFVTHAELDTALQNFITALNSHVHTDPSSGTTGAPVTPLSLDISLAETTTIKTDG